MKNLNTTAGRTSTQRPRSTRAKTGACDRAGVLSKSQITELFQERIVRGDDDCWQRMKPCDSAFDLHLGRECYELLGTTKLKRNEFIKSQLNSRFVAKKLDLRDLQELKHDKTYLVRLQETLDFGRHPEIHGRATGKSSVGRVDVLSHLLVDGEPSYDCVGSGYSGELYVQITPLTFSVLVKEGYALNQLRLFCGRPELSEISDGARAFERNLLVMGNATPVPEAIAGGFLRLSLAPFSIHEQKVSAFVAKPREDLPKDPLDLGKKRHYDPRKYWELVEKDQDYICAQKDRFYIVRSLERLCLPNDVAVECIAMSENLGDLRIHYAGFAHPTFGTQRKDAESGTPLMFEVRCFTKQVLRHEEQVARVKFYKMAKTEYRPPRAQRAPSSIGNPVYENQELQLSNIFAPWSKR